MSDGGLAAALAEMAIAGGTGAEIDLDPFVELRGCSGETALFGEGPGGIVLAAGSSGGALTERARGAGVDAVLIGVVKGDRLEISAAEREVSLAVADAAGAWNSLGPLMDASV